MRSYRIDIAQTEHGWAAECKAFSTTIDAGRLEDAVEGVRRECEDAAMRLLMEGKPLPADEPLDKNWTGKALYFRTSVQEDYEAGNQAPVRRNISMPAWLDKMLRRNNIDASKLFQEAAVARLSEIERTRGGYTKIASAADLEAACLPGVLDEYFERRLGGETGRIDPGRLAQLVAGIGRMTENAKELEKLTADGFASLLKQTEGPGRTTGSDEKEGM